MGITHLRAGFIQALLSEMIMSQTIKAILRIREFILNGEFTPGERLLETVLVDRLQVSRTPIRAALARLTEQGLLERVPGGGYAVREFSKQDIHDAIEMRGAIEGLAARFAVERGIDKLALNPLKDCLAGIDALLEKRDLDNDDIARYLDLNDYFHHQLVSLPNSFVVEHMIERIVGLPFASPNAFVMAQQELSQSWQIFFIAQAHHRSIVEAIENREGARAEALAREHAYLSLRVLRTVSENKPAFGQILPMVQYLDF